MTTLLLNEATGKHTKLRSDLEITQQETAGGVVYLINDPRTGRFCQFRQLEHFTAVQCNGNRSLDEIRERVDEEFDASLSLETLEQFLAKLRDLDLLESDVCEERLKSRQPRVQGSLLQVRARLFDPNRLLTWLLRPLAFVFTIEFLCLSGGLLLAATFVAIIHASEISSGLLRCARPELIVALVVAMVTVTMLHELAHGLTCKRFGGPVHEIGFLLIYFLPALYCNVSTAWAFPKKSHRLWVTFAGPWSTLLIWALAIFCWRLSLAGSGINTAALLVMAVTGVDTFFNLNPLIKLDGYYLLSDALEIPNLRQQAFLYLGNKARWLFGLMAKTKREVSTRHHRVLMIYGFLAVTYSTALLFVVAFEVGGFLMSHYQALGFIALVILLMILFRTPLVRIVSWPVGWLATRESLATCLPRPVWTLVCLGGSVTGLFLYPAELTVVGDVKIRAHKKVEIRAEVDGLISSVFVNEGQCVTGTQRIVCLASREIGAELAQTEAQVERQQAELALLKSGAKPEEIRLAEAMVQTAKVCHEHAGRRLEEAEKMQAERLRVAEAAVHEAESILQFATSQLARRNRLVKAKAISRSELEQTQAEVRKGSAKLVAAQAAEALVRAERLATMREQVDLSKKKWQEEKERLGVLRAGPKPAEIAVIEAQIEQLHARQRYLEDQIQRTEVSSPIAGTVTTARLEELVNRSIRRGELIAEVQQLESMRVDLSVSETEIGDVRVGCPVILRVLAYPGHTFRGQVTRMAPAAATADEQQFSRCFIVTTQIDNRSRRLRPGMTGKAKIISGQRLGMGRLLGRKLAQVVQVEFWSWWPRLCSPFASS